jgi:hypothetical protein
VGFYKPTAAAEGGEEGEGEDEGEGGMACTAEVSLDAPGAPRLDFPYICNMTVKTSFRR